MRVVVKQNFMCVKLSFFIIDRNIVLRRECPVGLMCAILNLRHGFNSIEMELDFQMNCSALKRVSFSRPRTRIIPKTCHITVQDITECITMFERSAFVWKLWSHSVYIIHFIAVNLFFKMDKTKERKKEKKNRIKKQE